MERMRGATYVGGFLTGSGTSVRFPISRATSTMHTCNPEANREMRGWRGAGAREFAHHGIAGCDRGPYHCASRFAEGPENREEVGVIVTVSRVRAADDQRHDLREHLLAFAARVAAEPGCRSWRVLENVADPADFTILAEFETLEARETLWGRPFFADFLADLPSLTEGELEQRTVRPIE